MKDRTKGKEGVLPKSSSLRDVFFARPFAIAIAPASVIAFPEGSMKEGWEKKRRRRRREGEKE